MKKSLEKLFAKVKNKSDGSSSNPGNENDTKPLVTEEKQNENKLDETSTNSKKVSDKKNLTTDEVQNESNADDGGNKSHENGPKQENESREKSEDTGSDQSESKPVKNPDGQRIFAKALKRVHDGETPSTSKTENGEESFSGQESEDKEKSDDTLSNLEKGSDETGAKHDICSDSNFINTLDDESLRKFDRDISNVVNVDVSASVIADDVKQEKKEDKKTENIVLPCNSCEFPDPILSVSSFNCFGLCKKQKPWDKISEYWLISVPKEDKAFEKLNSKTGNLSQNYKFHTPILKVGKLDELISLLEQLNILDNYVEGVTEKLSKHIKTELQDKPNHIEENLKVKNNHPAKYLTRFSWDRAKYPTWNSISIIADQIYSLVDCIQESLRQKIDLLENIKGSLKIYEQRETESLQVRYLGDLVKKEHFIQDSNFLTTLLVVVPNYRVKDWLSGYENLSAMVVPQSSVQIFDDGKDSLYNVTLSMKHVDEFRRNAQLNHFHVRDYIYSESKQKTEKVHFQRLSRVKIRINAEILRWVQVMFGESFEAWIHVKALRVFVESVLRFGLPVNFEAMLLLPLKSKSKLKDVLNTLYEDVDAALATGYMKDVPGKLLSYGVEEYYSYVYFNINLNFIYKT